MTPYRLGLTGSIGMGKSTTAAMFADEGIPVWDADATVHRLYAPGGAATRAVAAMFQDVMDGGSVSRTRLRAKIADDPKALDRLQAIVHPMVAEDRALFLATANAPIVVLDIPLLFETGADAECDGIAVVSAPPDVQRRRVLDRGEMTEAELEMILSRQIPDSEKRTRATWVIVTVTLDSAQASVKQIVAEIREKLAHA